MRGAVVRIGEIEIDRSRWDWHEVGNNPFFCPDPGTVPLFEEYLDGIRKAGSSVGAVIELVAEGVPPDSARRSMPSSTATSRRRSWASTRPRASKSARASMPPA